MCASKKYSHITTKIDGDSSVCHHPHSGQNYFKAQHRFSCICRHSTTECAFLYLPHRCAPGVGFRAIGLLPGRLSLPRHQDPGLALDARNMVEPKKLDISNRAIIRNLCLHFVSPWHQARRSATYHSEINPLTLQIALNVIRRFRQIAIAKVAGSSPKAFPPSEPV